ncbi:MAG: hypothetical protein Q4P66_04610 [Actinomycetaceae bacterium]|nr:hypothetical protein [Actinomycetaceae bacterium]
MIDNRNSADATVVNLQEYRLRKHERAFIEAMYHCGDSYALSPSFYKDTTPCLHSEQAVILPFPTVQP